MFRRRPEPNHIHKIAAKCRRRSRGSEPMRHADNWRRRLGRFWRQRWRPNVGQQPGNSRTGCSRTGTGASAGPELHGPIGPVAHGPGNVVGNNDSADFDFWIFIAHLLLFCFFCFLFWRFLLSIDECIKIRCCWCSVNKNLWYCDFLNSWILPP